MISPLDGFLLLLVVATGAAVLAITDLLDAVVVFGAFSFFSAAFFASLGALDVAFTEAAVGAAITTVLFVAVMRRVERLPRGPRRPPPRSFALASVAALAVAGVVLARAVLELPAVGDPLAPAARHVSPRYIEDGPAETGAPNMVTGVLADYRAYDTLGETVVILTAGLACALVLGNVGAAGAAAGATRPLASPVLDTASRLLTPFIFVFAAYVVAHGHVSPGGGFQGGILLAAALILVRLVRRERTWGLSPRGALVAACTGVAIFAATGFAALAFGGRFLDYGALPLPLDPAATRAAGSLVIEVGVGLGVMGVMLLIFDALGGPLEEA